MKIHTSHRGSDRPFERDRQLVLRCLPQGATIRAATATIVPVSNDVDGRFLESILFGTVDNDWGAIKRVVGSSIEVDLRARRQLASLKGQNLSGTELLVDLGGGFTAVDRNGGLGGSGHFEGDDDLALPGLTVSGLRLAEPDAGEPDITSVRVASPPLNVTMAVVGGPTFWTHFGPLVDPTITPDFAPLLQEALAWAPVEHGHHVVEFAVHSDSIARLDVSLDIDFVVTTSATPEGVDQVSLPYGFGSAPDAAANALAISVPSGTIAAPGSTTGRVQGSFAPSRIVHGPSGRVGSSGVARVSASASQAEPFSLDELTLVTSVDVLVASVTASAEIAVDIVGDLDGKPDRVSLLSEVATRRFTRDDAPDSTWMNVALPSEIELDAELRYWIIMQAREGTVSWDYGHGGSSLGLQTTVDGGLSWRAIEADSAHAHFRLRHTTPTFHMPLELRVDAGAGETTVNLDRFGDAGRIDFSLEFPEVAAAINASIDAAGVNAVPRAEHIANGEFDEWFRLGSGMGIMQFLPRSESATLAAFSPDGATVYLAGSSRFTAADTYCGSEMYSAAVPAIQNPRDMLIDPTGRFALVAATVADGVEVRLLAAASVRSVLTLIELDGGSAVASPIFSETEVSQMATARDGSGVYLLADGPQGEVARVSWEQLQRTVASTDGEDLFASAVAVGADPTVMAVGPDGLVYVATTVEEDTRLTVFDGGLGPDSFRSIITVADVGPAQGLTFVTSGELLVVLGESHLVVIDRTTARVRSITPVDGLGTSLVADPLDDSVLVIVNDEVVRFDTSNRTFSTPLSDDGVLRLDAISPPGNRVLTIRGGSEFSSRFVERLGQDLPADWEITAGQVRPGCFGADGISVAQLGEHDDESNTRPVNESALSQVVAVAADMSYRFSFDAVASLAGATGQILWRTEDCGSARVDTVDIAEPGAARSSLQSHELRVRSPVDAVQAEVRFHTPEGVLYVDSVSLAGSNEAVTNTGLTPTAGSVTGWQTAPTLSASVDGDGATQLFSSGAGTSLAQVSPVTGSQYSLEAVASIAGDTSGVAITLDFLDDFGALVGDQIVLPIEALGFDRLAASGEVVGDAAEAKLAVVVPATTSTTIESLSLSFNEPVPVELGFISEAPGELVVSDVTVGLDDAPPAKPPIPDVGLCPATPPGMEPGDDDSCHCPACGKRSKVRQPTSIRTPAGRGGIVATCPGCGQPIVSVRGRVAAHAPEMSIGRFTLPRRLAHTVRRAVPANTISVSLEEISGIGPGRSSELASLGIATMFDLSTTTPALVGRLRGVSMAMAKRFINDAIEIVRHQNRPGH